jgi:hypothetical protein
MSRSQTTRSTICILLLGVFATLQLLIVLDGELGDQHDDRLQRRPNTVSIYISIAASRIDISATLRHAFFLLVMMSLAARYLRSSSVTYFVGVLAWTIMMELGMLGMIARPHQLFRSQSKKTMLMQLDAKCSAWGNSTKIGLFVPPLGVSERVAYCLGSRWRTHFPRNRTNWHRTNWRSSTSSLTRLPACFESSSHEMLHTPVCFALHRWEALDGPLATNRLHKTGLSEKSTTFEHVLFAHGLQDLVHLAARLRELRWREPREASQDAPGDRLSGAIPIRFGDGWLHDETLPFPVLVQCVQGPREAVSPPASGPASVLWRLHRERYYGSLFQVLKDDTMPFAHKRDVAVWRGVTTGAPSGYGAPRGQEPPGWPGRPVQRAALVRRLSEKAGLWAGNGSVLDVGVTKYVQGAREALVSAGFVPPAEVPMLTDAQLLSKKMIIIAEGNDAASGLKWALCSTSAVLMPPPTAITWIMEDQLEPWVHYVPLAQDFSDLEDKARWCLANQGKCEAIGMAGRCYIRQFMDEDVETAVEHVILEHVVDELESTTSVLDGVCRACK